MDIALKFDMFDTRPVAYGVVGPPAVDTSTQLPSGATLNASFTVGADGLTCNQLTITGDNLTTSAVEPLPLDTLRQETARAVLATGFEGEGYRPHSDPHLSDEVLDEWPRGDLDVLLRHVAALHNWAALTGHGPTKALQDAAGVSKSTAIRMLRTTKAHGYKLVDLPARTGGAQVPARVQVQGGGNA